MQALLRTNSRKVADGECLAIACAGNAVMPGQIDAQRHDVEFLGGQAEVVGHEVPVVGGMHEKTIEAAGSLADGGQRLAAIGFVQVLQENVVPLQDAENAAGVLPPDRADGSNQERIAE